MRPQQSPSLAAPAFATGPITRASLAVWAADADQLVVSELHAIRLALPSRPSPLASLLAVRREVPPRPASSVHNFGRSFSRYFRGPRSLDARCSCYIIVRAACLPIGSAIYQLVYHTSVYLFDPSKCLSSDFPLRSDRGSDSGALRQHLRRIAHDLLARLSRMSIIQDHRGLGVVDGSCQGQSIFAGPRLIS